jgi:hypothetical protein
VVGALASFRVPEESYEGLGILAGLGRERIEKLIERLSAEPLTLDFGAVAARLALSVGAPVGEMETVLSSALIPLNQICYKYGQSAKEFVSNLVDLVEEQASSDWLERHGATWPEAGRGLEPLFAPGKFLRLASKAVDLLYERPALLLDFRVLTELRPLYDEEVSTIRALIQTNTLVIEYHQGEERRSLHMSIDSDDLRLMGDQLARVLKKNELVSSQAKNWNLDLLTTDED